MRRREGSSYYGYSVALSGDGSRAIVGANENIVSGGPGSARIFARNGATWAAEAAPDGHGGGEEVRVYALP